MKLLFIPNWNGHLHIQEKDDSSVRKIFDKVDFYNKELVEVEKLDSKKTNSNISEAFLKADDFVLSIAGDHSNSYPLIEAFASKNSDFKLVIFDAHPDVEVSTDMISHEDYLRNLIDNGIVRGENVYLFGIRTFSRTEFEYLIDKKVNFWTISDVLKDKEDIKKIISEIDEDVYLSIDIDVLDPDDAPGTYYREWCGLKIDELEEFVDVIKPKVKSCDINEFYSEKDENEITEKNVIRLIDRFIK